MKFLIYGSKGWIGSYVVKLLKDDIVVEGQSRVDDEESVNNEIIKHQPDRVICLIGRTYGPGCNTIDYLEQKGKLVENVKDNLFSPVILALLCEKYNIHMTYLGTGCIFNGYDNYTELDKPNFFGSSYSVVKGFTDRIMHMLNNVLNVRIRMPITDDDSPRNFITKIMNYKKICSIPNSMSVLPELLPIMIDMSKNKITGTINLVNPGVISHNEILEMVKEIIDSNFTWENMTIEEQNKILLAERSNNSLSTEKLESMYKVKNIKESVRDILLKINERSRN